MRILIIEDEKALAHTLQRGLTEEGYLVDCAFDGDSGLESVRSGSYDAILLDVEPEAG